MAKSRSRGRNNRGTAVLAWFDENLDAPNPGDVRAHVFFRDDAGEAMQRAL